MANGISTKLSIQTIIRFTINGYVHEIKDPSILISSIDPNKMTIQIRFLYLNITPKKN